MQTVCIQLYDSMAGLLSTITLHVSNERIVPKNHADKLQLLLPRTQLITEHELETCCTCCIHMHS